ncbi:hypothetical protein, partial [Mesorhizobium sp. M0678]|uniref:hypothetical protein n=1 Tax=Mesorhizobium sp. M0678 TaxID=2956985 RepID=UPI00333A6064
SHPLAPLFATWSSVPDKYSTRKSGGTTDALGPLQNGAVLDAVKAWPGNLAAGRGAIAPASLDCVSTRSRGKSCGPGRRNRLT